MVILVEETLVAGKIERMNLEQAADGSRSARLV